jgi:hypothetical protein
MGVEEWGGGWGLNKFFKYKIDMSKLREREEFFTISGVDPDIRTISDLEPFILQSNPNLTPEDLDREVISIITPIVISFQPLKKVDGSKDYTRRSGHFPQYPGTKPINGDRPGFILPFDKLLFYENNNGILHLFEPTEEYIEINDKSGKLLMVSPSVLSGKYINKEMITWTPRHP